MFYFMLWETLHKTLGKGGQFDGKGIHPDGHMMKGVTDDDYANDCGKPQFEGEPNQRTICEDHCPNPVSITLLRHDHLNGPRAPAGNESSRTACSWKQELASHPWVVLHTGTHINDSPEENGNVDNIWEKRADGLFKYLKDVHPHGIVWRTAHSGTWEGPRRTAPKMLCADPTRIRDTPLPDKEIPMLFNGSWARFPLINSVYKSRLKEYLPDALLLDTAPLMSMRGDCRKDPIHFDWHDQRAPIHMWTRMLQHFMQPLHA